MGTADWSVDRKLYASMCERSWCMACKPPSLKESLRPRSKKAFQIGQQNSYGTNEGDTNHTDSSTSKTRGGRRTGEQVWHAEWKQDKRKDKKRCRGKDRIYHSGEERLKSERLIQINPKKARKTHKDRKWKVSHDTWRSICQSKIWNN